MKNWPLTLGLLLGFLLACATEERARAQGAAEAVAEQEMAVLTDAEETVLLDTGFYTTIENLDDLIAYYPLNNPFDDINDQGGTRVLDPDTGRWTPDRKDLRNPPMQWMGPYVVFQPSRITLDGAGYDPGTLLDPWGRPYYLFTPLGLARPVEGTITLELYGDRFDRYAVVSLGPDGVMSGDDLFRFFGSAPTRLAVSSLTPSSSPVGQPATIRGYHFGASQGASRILLDGREIGAADSWADHEIVFHIPAWATSGGVQVEVGGVPSQPPLALAITLSRANPIWRQYQ
ncbi:MAG: IPT/TIG domain-containing protein [Candidatus Sumerlaeota bacterium]|nr:IPT/TIG domain-containing protein [Candidatus Sumerlaeota bacterium]